MYELVGLFYIIYRMLYIMFIDYRYLCLLLLCKSIDYEILTSNNAVT